MLTVLEYARISQDVYQDPPPLLLKGYTLTEIKQFGKSLTGIVRIENIAPLISPTNDFYAQLYVNLQKGKAIDAVVAYRGTTFVHDGSHLEIDFDNYFVDVESWYKNVLSSNNAETNVPDYMGLATTFYLKARRYVKEHFPEIGSSWLNVTGHSLGGAMAALMPSKYFAPAMAVTFNAPGIATVPEVDKRMGGRILGIEARYDFISKIGEHIGKVELVDVPNEESDAKAAFEASAKLKKLSNESHRKKLDVQDLLTFDEMRQKGTEEVDFGLSVLPQHKMLNLLHALEKPENAKIANQTLFF